MKTVLVTGGNGQLASCIKDISDSLKDTRFIYTDLPEFDIVNKEVVASFFAENNVTVPNNRNNVNPIKPCSPSTSK